MDHDDLISIEDLSEPLTYPVEAFISKEYAIAEKDMLWPKIWQMAGRVEEIPNIGDYITYDICEESIIVIRVSDNSIKAYYNVCPHRGRRLIDLPKGEIHGSGNTRRFVCGFHGWSYNPDDGKNIHILDKEDWKGALTEEMTCLTPVKVDTWGGWIYINLNEDCDKTLREFLEPAASILDPFEFEKMRFKWRQWVVFDCNWKTAIEAFMEPYHVAGTHTQLLKYGDYYAYSAAKGDHGVSGFDQRKSATQTKEGTTVTRAGNGKDPRKSTYDMQREIYESVNFASTTLTLVNAAKRLVDELPEDTSAQDVMVHWLKRAREDDAARGVVWPNVSQQQMSEAGLAWSLFPNQTILQGLTFALCYRVRPWGDDPDKCIFESYAIERFPEGEEPQTEWVYAEPTKEKWGLVLSQDFSNMEAVQKGMHSRSFRGTLPNPHQERKVTNFHRVLSQYMEAGYPKLIK